SRDESPIKREVEDPLEVVGARRARQALAGQCCRRDDNAMIRHFALQAGYQRAGRNEFTDGHGMEPDGLTTVIPHRGRKKAQTFSKADGVLAVTGGLIEKVRDQSEEQQRKGDAVEEMHPGYESPKPATVAGSGASLKKSSTTGARGAIRAPDRNLFR